MVQFEDVCSSTFMWVQSCISANSFDVFDGEDLHKYLARLSREFESHLQGFDVCSVSHAKALVPYYRAILSVLFQQFKKELLNLLNSLHVMFDSNPPELPVSIKFISALGLWLPLEPRILSILSGAVQNMVHDHNGSYKDLASQVEAKLVQNITRPLNLLPALESRWRDLLFTSMRDDFISFRSAQIFDYVLDYPDSETRIAQLMDSFYPGCLVKISKAVEDSYCHLPRF